LPLGEPAFYILLSLATGEKHGYAIMKDVTVLSDGATRLSASTLYENLSRLLEQDLIERVEGDEVIGSRRPRKAYHLSQRGGQVLAAETRRMQRMVDKVHLRLVRGEP
jgi:PadR family transcriptional regulator PadR